MTPTSGDTSTHIGTLNEQPLHAALKKRYAAPGARFEVEVDGFVVDVAQEDLLVEIQTGNFSGIRDKIVHLAEHHSLLLVYPIAREKWLLKLPKERGGQTEQRKSPKRGRPEELFKELVSFPKLICRDTFSLEVVLTQEEEVRRYDPQRWRNRGWVTVERRLLDVVDRRTFRSAPELASLLPQGLPSRFTTADLAQALDGPRWLAQKMAYCLRKTDAIVQVGRRGRSNLYTRKL
ncbi:MAG: hypothetical protein ACOC7N_05645 [Chloroflexota bacterium]